MNRMLVLFALYPILLLAQFSELATTYDGGHLYFSSNLRWKGQPAGRAESRIYRVTETGAIQLYVERGDLAVKNSFGSGDGARTPQVSADGLTVALTLQGICEPPSECTSNSQWRAEVRGRYAAVLGDGAVYLSGNGKWALLTPPFSATSDPGATLINLETSERTMLPPLPTFVAHPLASDGSVIIQTKPAGLAIWSQGQSTPVTLSGIISVWGRSDDGTLLLYTSIERNTAAATFRVRLMAKSIATGKDTELYAGKEGEFPQFMGVTANGRAVLYRVTGRSVEGPAFIVDTSTGRTSALTLPAGELATDGTLSGSGNAAFLVTTTGRIARFDVASGTPTDAVPATPYLRSTSPLSTGARVAIQGTLPHSRAALDGNLLLNDHPLAILSVSDSEIVAQVPWEVVRNFETPLRVNVSSDSPFQQNELVYIAEMSPRFEGTPPAGVGLPGIAIKADFSSVLTADPQPGEVFHMYMTGLGAVQGSIATGAATPLSPLLPIQGRLTCLFRPYTQNAETLFAGLAPGLTGFYQVTFRMPSEAAPGRLSGGQCEGSGVNFIWASLMTTP